MRKTTKRKPTKIVVPTGEALRTKLKELSIKYEALDQDRTYTRCEIQMLSNICDTENNIDGQLQTLKDLKQNYITFKQSN